MSEAPEDILWTSAFLNERFSTPVSPLGWSLIQGPLEELAFRDPLRYLRVPNVEHWPLTRLYRGYPFVNVAVFQALYKLFPDFFLPEDARRYFPGGEVRLRKDAPYPRSLLAPRLWLSLGLAAIREFGLVSPWHNADRWARFTARQTAELDRLAAGPHETPEEIWRRIEAARRLDGEFLAIHRWSLTLADLTYTLLRRLARAWLGSGADAVCARLVAGLPNRSVEVDAELQGLAAIAREMGSVAPPRQLADNPAFRQALDRFLAQYGHRSFTLDVVQPPFRAAPEQVLELVEELAGAPAPPPLASLSPGPRGGARAGWPSGQGLCQPGTGERATQERRAAEQAVRRRLDPLRRALFGHLLALARRYVILREDQRFHWQRSLALQRDLFVALGRQWVAEGILEHADEIFFATIKEVEAATRGTAPLPIGLMRQRRLEHDRLVEASRAAPETACPPFLRGDEPWWPDATDEVVLRGRGVSPGLARGPVRVVVEPARLSALAPGDVLVTRSTDPGWTPIFGVLAGLVMEHGGQLSHGAVVAREYGLPAVAGVAGATRRLRDGEIILVDGDGGVVRRLDMENREAGNHHDGRLS